MTAGNWKLGLRAAINSMRRRVVYDVSGRSRRRDHRPRCLGSRPLPVEKRRRAVSGSSKIIALKRRKIVAVSTDAAQVAEMHEMRMDRMMMVMTARSRIFRFRLSGKTSLNPDNLHIMLFGLKSRPTIGDMIQVTLKFDDGSTVPVTAILRKK